MSPTICGLRFTPNYRGGTSVRPSRLAPVKLCWFDGLAKGQPLTAKTVEPRWKYVEDSARNLPHFSSITSSCREG